MAAVEFEGGCAHALGHERSRSGCTVCSFLPTMYQVGFDFQAVPPAFALNRSGFGTPWVAQTSFCSGTARLTYPYRSADSVSSVRFMRLFLSERQVHSGLALI